MFFGFFSSVTRPTHWAEESDQQMNSFCNLTPTLPPPVLYPLLMEVKLSSRCAQIVLKASPSAATLAISLFYHPQTKALISLIMLCEQVEWKGGKECEWRAQ